MKAEEFRIGNYIKNHHGGIDVVTGVFDNFGITELCFKNADDAVGTSMRYVAPIPLTHEILEKAGFKKGLGDFYYKGGIEYNPTEQLLEGFGYCEILYLHQLQNLYYALTGEELEINLA